ncbi:unnamed protein product [Sphagnum balticum]
MSVARSVIGKSVGNNPIELLTVTEPLDRKQDNRKIIVIMARQHPGETQGSYELRLSDPPAVPNSNPISRKGKREVKDMIRNTRQMRVMEISRVNSILPDKYQLALEPAPAIPSMPYVPESLDRKRMTMKQAMRDLKINTQTQTTPMGESTCRFRSITHFPSVDSAMERAEVEQHLRGIQILRQSRLNSTPYYASPEVWNDKPYDMKSDIWSLGCVIYEMAALRPPFQATDLQGLYKKVKAGVFDRIPSIYSSDLSSLIAQMLKISPSQRPSTDEILSNPVVTRHYNQGGLLPASTERKELLQTIKFNPYNLKALKDKLPRANYFKESQDRESSQDRIQAPR